MGGKKAPGTLEIHSTGLRFQAARGEKLDLLFKNIKLAFFQPAERDSWFQTGRPTPNAARPA